MSFADVRPFFRTRLEGLGYVEHEDVVDDANVASSLLDESFILLTDAITGLPADLTTHEFDYSVILKIYRRGFADAIEAYDTADSDIDTVLADILDPAVRNGTTIKDIVAVSINKLPLSGENDNDVLIEFSFSIKLINCY